MVEINVMLIMTSMDNVMQVTMKYISLAAIVNIPRIYFEAVKTNNVMKKVHGFELPIMYTRKDNPLEGAPIYMKILRGIYKICRTFFCSIGFYFMPFTAIVININHMYKNPDIPHPSALHPHPAALHPDPTALHPPSAATNPVIK